MTNKKLKTLKINEIKLNRPLEDKIFITFDLDWCSDEVLLFTLELVNQYNMKCTIFVTHETPILKYLRENPKIELGIHPNFNCLLNGNTQYGKNIEEVIDYYLNIVPQAISVRSHSMTQNTEILQLFSKKGLVFDCNTFIPFSSGIILKPFRYFIKNIIKVPYFWEDDVYIISEKKYKVDDYIKYPGLKVFDFHPIHIYLNTEKIERYNEAKKELNHTRLRNLINTKSYGIRNFFIDLIEKLG